MLRFLFVVGMPPCVAMASSPDYPFEWKQFEDAANTILKPVKACTRLQKNVWLLPAENALPVLLDLSSKAAEYSLAYSALLISGEVMAMTSPEKKQ